MSALAYVPDLIDRSKVAAALRAVRFVAHPEDLVGCQADLVVAAAVCSTFLVTCARTRVAGFAAHVDAATLAAARSAGAKRCVERSASGASARSPTRPAGEPI